MRKTLAFFTRYKTPTALLAILVLAFVLRAWGLGNNPFVADEFIDLNASEGYAQTEQWKAWNFNLAETDTLDPYDARDERSWVYRWQVAQVFNLFGVSEESARSVSVFWGAITVLIVFWSARVFTKSTPVALLASFLFAVSITGIEYNRKLRMYAMFTPIFLILSTWLFLFLESGYPFKKPLFLRRISDFFGLNILYSLPVIAIGLLAVHLQLLTVNIVFSLFGYFLTIILIGRFFPKILSISRSALWGTGAFISGLVVSILFFPQIPQAILGTSKFFMDNYGYLEKSLRDFEHPLLGGILVLLGIFWLFRIRQKPKEALWLATSLLIPLLLTIFVWSRAQGVQYVFYLLPFTLILASCGVASIGEFLEQKLRVKHTRRAFIATFLIAGLLLPWYGYFITEATTYNRGNDPVADYRKVFTYLKKTHKKEPHALITRNFRNYYYRDWNTPVLEFGGERAPHDLTLQEIQDFICAHNNGFVVIFDNDWNYVTKDGRTFVENALPRVDHSSVRGASRAYEWGPEHCETTRSES